MTRRTERRSAGRRPPGTHPAESRVLECNTPWGQSRYEFHSRDGLHSPEEFRTADLLLLDALTELAPDSLLVHQGNDGVVGTVAADLATAVTMTETSARAAGVCERNVAHNTVDASVSVTADVSTLPERFDTAVYAPRPYTALDVGVQRIANALAALEPGGELLVAARASTGLTRYRDSLADLAESAASVTERNGWEVIRARRPAVFEPPSFVERHQFRETVDVVDLTLVSEPGLFSAGELDHGTRLLLESVELSGGERVLDLCCGYGPIGAYAAVRDCEVWLSDDDRRATACAMETLAQTGVDGEVVTGDATAAVSDRTFDRILCNPPTHAGSGVLADLFAGAKDVLAPDGSLWLVHHRKLDLSRHLRRFARVDEMSTGEEHVVMRAVP